MSSLLHRLLPGRLFALFAASAALALASLDAFAQTTQPPTDDWRTRPEIACDILRQPGVAAGTWAANLWPGGIIPYVFSGNTDASMRAAMLQSMSDIEAVCNVHFITRTNQDNYLFIQNANGNSSYVGMQDFAGQPVNIFNWNREFVMCHELMHAMGLWHEQSRGDRGGFVVVNYDNIQPQYAYNFDIVDEAAPTGDFDFDSVMLYGACSFSVCCPTGTICACDVSCAAIQALPQWSQFQAIMGQRTHLSQGDIAGMVSRYGAPTCGLTFGSPTTQISTSQCQYTYTLPFSVASAITVNFTWYARPSAAAQWSLVGSSSQNYAAGNRTLQFTRPFSATGKTEQLRVDWTAGACSNQVITNIALSGWTVSTQPASKYLCKIGNTTLNAAGSGPVAPSYQWQVELGAIGSDNWTNLSSGPLPASLGSSATVSNVTTANLTITKADPAASRRYRVVVGTPCSGINSNPATVSVCVGDINCDQTSDLSDFFAFFNAWDTASLAADVNADAALDLNDFFGFLNAFDAGC